MSSRSTRRATAMSPTVDPTQVKQMADNMKLHLETMMSTFQALEKQAEAINALSPTTTPVDQINEIRRQIKDQDRKQKQRVEDVQRIVRDALKDQIAESMKAQIANQIQAEIALQVKEQVKSQISAKIPVLPVHQAEKNTAILATVQTSLDNIEARRINRGLSAGRPDDALKPILCTNGTLSPIYPSTLNEFYQYDDEKLAELLRDYDLAVDGSRSTNLNRFIAHIGGTFNVVSM